MRSALNLLLACLLSGSAAGAALAQAPTHGVHSHHHVCHEQRPWPTTVGAYDEGAGSADTRGEAGDKQKDDWSVAEPPGDHYTVDLDVTEGTWMNLDVSPDGRHIVFDLFGDIYRMPIAGGDAEVLTSGFPWDMQPRYSPDGRSILFTSDRSGGDNIWVLPLAEGAEPRAVTDENFRLLNNGAWSPDGRFIVARKHFTASRSLGAGEIWMYHSSGEGTGGLRLNERPNDQKDLGEPAFSADGEHVYFSQDVTPGATFDYNKDPNQQIYQIKSIELATGDIETVVSGNGGAVRPTPSPDGNYLAFVRRLSYKTALFVRDLNTGEEKAIFDGLDRDLQETWAVHGVYANFAWTPDSRSLVFWAGGKVHRIDFGDRLTDARLSEIPFRVRNQVKMAEALRFPQDVFQERFPAKMLRWVSVAPGGKQVVFQAVGKLWIQDLPNGKARRLTQQDDHFEVYPSWSRDGGTVIYVSWNDGSLGAVRAVSTTGGSTRVLTTEPGHFVNPVLSPDGKHVVYRKTSGGFITSPLHSDDPGLYVQAVAGGDPVLLTENGGLAHFGAASDRVFFRAFEGGKRVLKSVDLDGQEERTHATSEAATEVKVSPDGQWLAFVERFDVHVVPFAAAAMPLKLGSNVSSVPHSQVSKDAGEYLHWGADSDRLYWSLGPELFEVKLNQAFGFLDGAPEELPDAPTTGTALRLEVASDLPLSTIALVGGRVVTLEQDASPESQVIEDGVVLVKNNRIEAVGDRASVTIPDGAVVVDVSGKTVVPGFVDVHWHGSQGSEEIQPQQNWSNLAGLAFGVTTVHDPSNDTSTFFAASEMQKAGEILAPRLYSTGTILYGADGDFKAEIDSLEDAQFHLNRMKAVGAFSVKSYNQPRRDQRQQVIAAARELEMLVVPEGGSLYMHNMTQVIDGHTGIEHAIPLAHLYEDVRQVWSGSRVGYTPTIGVGYGGIWGENYWYAKTDVWANERLLSFVPRARVEARSRRPFQAPDEEYNHFKIAAMCKELSDRGVRVTVGAHGQREGLAVHWEMWMLEQGGMSPLEALRAGTLNGAWYLGMDHELGSIEKGKLADLAIIDGNPLEDLRQSENVSHVMLNGRLYDAATMNQLLPDTEERAPLFFEGQDEPLISAR